MRNSPIYDRLGRCLNNRRREGLFRVLAVATGEVEIDLSSNSYLSLQTNATVKRAARALAADCTAGNGASRLIAAGSSLFTTLEDELVDWNNSEAALLFGSGYAANVGIIQAVCDRGTEVFSDRFNHASIVDGIVLSRARLNRYRHCDMADLKKRLAASKGREKIIITESVFSMDGDCAPLADICELARLSGSMVMVDEAHATGLFGTTGSGKIEACGIRGAVDIHMGTLSKSVAGLGGFAVVNGLLKDFLVNYAHSLIYSTGLPHSILAWDLAAVQYIRQHPLAGKNLLEDSCRFREELARLGFSTGTSTTHVVPCITGTNAKAMHLSTYLAEQGIKAPAIRSPTVPAGAERVRFSLHCGFDRVQRAAVVDVLKKWKALHG